MQSKKWLLKTTPSSDAPTPSLRGGSPVRDDLIQQIVHTLNISPVTAGILIQRNIQNIAQAKSFLKPDINNISSPHLITGIPQALHRIEQTLLNNEKILVYGDYDVDGITSVVLLKRFFRLLGREIDFYIPHRLTKGYGLSREAISEIAQKAVNLIITVDCGISNHQEVAYAKQLGMDVIITDHHEIPSQLPECTIVSAKMGVRPPQSSSAYFLSGVGIAFKLCWAMMDTFSQVKKHTSGFQDFIMDAMALVALGTIADVAPIVGENRILCSYGLQALQHSKMAGLQALAKQAGLRANVSLKAEDISFRLGPRLNAAGRLGYAHNSVKLLLSDNPSEIEKLVEQLERDNRERQKIETKIMQQVSKTIKDHYDLDTNFAIVLSDDGWHSGVLGIVASKLAEEFYRPTVLISTENDIGKGSARSIPSFHLYDALNCCRELLLSVGGHEYAAGLVIDRSNIPALRTHLNNYAKERLKANDFTPFINIDGVLSFQEISKKLVTEIGMLSPFGEGNEEPVFSSDTVRLAGVPKLIGNNLKHLAFYVKQNGRAFRVIAFNRGSYIDLLDRIKDKPFSLAYTLKLNTWRDEESIELEFVDIKI
ncbi:MAG: single-stranded-DNA-specific exonuclease RecJ [Planctomycetota bacterium]|nr:single-stranded-DNA-specific exonuclease RecJ [Planctomycetota bacterium]MDI6787606.1 single-stranded-DNA-specific exonuclease RecJ [Planctomycetota bacterium]